MRKSRKEYAYVAHRIDPDNPQNLGDFSIIRWNQSENTPREHYQYASESYTGRGEDWWQGRIVNRRTLRQIGRGTRIYSECIRAVERLLSEDEDNQ